MSKNYSEMTHQELNDRISELDEWMDDSFQRSKDGATARMLLHALDIIRIEFEKLRRSLDGRPWKS